MSEADNQRNKRKVNSISNASMTCGTDCEQEEVQTMCFLLSSIEGPLR